jgi:hypothetical protein
MKEKTPLPLKTKGLQDNGAFVHKKLSELTPDSRNANKGTPRGNQMIEDSLRLLYDGVVACIL